MCGDLCQIILKLKPKQVPWFQNTLAKGDDGTWSWPYLSFTKRSRVQEEVKKMFLLVQEADNSPLEWEIQLSTHSTECVFRLHYVCGELRYKHCVREVQDKAFLLFSNMILEQKHKPNMETIKKKGCLDWLRVSGNMHEWNSLRLQIIFSFVKVLH